MKFIVNGKIYDTDKAEKVLNYRRRFPLPLFPQLSEMYDMVLYKTSKGNWFSLKCEDFGKKSCIVNTEKEVKEIFEKCGRDDLHAQYFGELEEA